MLKKINPQKEAMRLTELWQSHGPNTYPINLDILVEGICGSSDFPDELNIVRKEFDSFEGCLLRQPGKRAWTILLNESIINTRRYRFTFAHELGHFMCHRELQSDFKDSYDTINNFTDKLENEANLFASWLLMPANLMRSRFENSDWNVDTLQNLGNYFECSLQASAIRFVQLSSKPIAFVVSRDGIVLWSVKSKAAPFMASYKFGDELPEGSEALKVSRGEGTNLCIFSQEVWSRFGEAIESQYVDTIGNGYQYTCIKFQI